VGSTYVYKQTPVAWVQQAKLTSADAAAGDVISAVAIVDDTVLTGARRADGPNGIDSGRVSSFTRSGIAWSEGHALVPSYQLPEFGWNVAIGDGTAVVATWIVGQDYGGEERSIAWVFEEVGGTWTQTAELTMPGYPGVVQTMASMVVDDDTIVLSSGGYVSVFVRSGGEWSLQQPFEQGGGIALAGDVLAIGAHLFARTAGTWTEVVAMSSGQMDDGFGTAVALSDTTFVVGAYKSVSDLGETGAVYVFEKSGNAWLLDSVLTAPDPIDQDAFGTNVELSGDTMLVRAKGAVHVFTRTGGVWSAVAELDPPAGSTDAFGEKLALDGDIAIVGDEEYAQSLGRVSVFTRSGSTWALSAVIMPPFASVSGYGKSVALDGDLAIVGGYHYGLGVHSTDVANIHQLAF